MRFGERPLNAARGALERGGNGQGSSRGQPASKGTGRTVEEVMTSPAVTVGSADPLREAAKAMQREEIGDVLVVTDSGGLEGIVTDRDLAVRSVAEGLDPDKTNVADVMSPIAVTIEPSATTSDALDLMRRHDVRRMPVTKGSTLVGIVSLGDLSRADGAGDALADISTAPANN
jgi:CBS domain-containing protein